MANPTFEGMAECTFCESGTFEPVQIRIAGRITGTYCKRCWREFGDTQPVDNSGDTPK